MRAALIVLALALHAQEQPAIRVPVRLVTVPALVFSKDNRLLPNLRESNFRVLDNGAPQTFRIEESVAPLSIAVVVQTSLDIRDYLPFIAKAGSVIETLVAGASGESAVVTYGDSVTTVKPFDSGDLSAALKSVRLDRRYARLLDAGVRAASLLAERPASRTRVLLFIGQPIDKGSESTLASLAESVARDNVAVFALALPLMGKSFVSDTFSLQGVSKAERGGYRASTDLKNLVRVLSAGSATVENSDPFSTLIAATGGTQLHIRTQRQLEDGLATIGFQLRSAYQLTYYPSSVEPGHHTVSVEVDVPGAKVYARPGYWRTN